VVVPEALRDLPGLSVKRDGTEVGRAVWGVAIPVDRGQHTVVANATGKPTWTKTVDVVGDGIVSRVTVELPAEGPPAAPPQVDAPRSRGPALAIAGFSVAGAGIVVGAVTGGLTLAKDCKANTCTVSQLSSAKTLAWVSDFGFGFGLAGAVVGIVGLAIDRPKPATSAFRIRVAPNRLSFEGTF
jgi:hypothetical protein